MGIPETALHPQELPLDDHSVICLHSLTRLALPVITITRGCGCLINPKQPCVVSIVTYRVTMGRTEIFKFDASTHHLRSCSSIHRTLVLRAIDFSRPFIFIKCYKAFVLNASSSVDRARLFWDIEGKSPLKFETWIQPCNNSPSIWLAFT